MTLSKKKAIELIDEKITQFESILANADYENINSQEYELAYYGTADILAEFFSEDDKKNFFSRTSYASYIDMSPQQKLDRYKGKISNCITQLKVYRDKIENFWKNETVVVTEGENIMSGNKKVFIVHGRDEGLKNQLEVLLFGIGLEPVVLHRQADEGMTIIEKFEKHSDVGYAFILLTPDDVAYSAFEEDLPDTDRKKEYRARPNVIFEFGFFVGKLGRNKVCCLYKKGVSLPTDVSGMIYKEIQDSVEQVGLAIIKDLKAAGYDINV